MDFLRLDVLSLFYIETPFTNEEIFYTLREVGSDKAHGLDGFSIRFVKTY